VDIRPRPRSGREQSRNEWRTSRIWDGISRSARPEAFVGRRGSERNDNINAMKNDSRLADHRMMRSSKTEYAMRTRRVVGIAGREVRYIPGVPLGVVKTKFDGRRAVTGWNGEGEPADCNKQALRGHRIGDNHTDQRP